ncbi:hypothetical protein CsatB_029465 [Cannabis sativa]
MSRDRTLQVALLDMYNLTRAQVHSCSAFAFPLPTHGSRNCESTDSVRNAYNISYNFRPVNRRPYTYLQSLTDEYERSNWDTTMYHVPHTLIIPSY